MSEFESDAEESTDVKPRLRRAICEKMTVTEKGGDVYEVHSSSGGTYEVDAVTGRCTCPDAQYHLSDGKLCKHCLRVEIVRGDRAIPAAVDRDAVDPLLGCAVETTSVAVATDGGQDIVAGAEDNGRPDDCGCWNVDADLPCFSCYQAGFDEPNPETPGDNGGGE